VNKEPITFSVGRDGVVRRTFEKVPARADVLLMCALLQVKRGDWRVFNLKVDKNGRVTVTDPDAA
jgi:hypothetical protein